MNKHLVPRLGAMLLAVIALIALQQARTEPLPAPEALNPSKPPQITWSEKRVELVLSPGESASRDLSLTTSGDIHDVVLETTSGLAPFLALTPASLSTLTAAVAQPVHIAFTVAPDAAPGTYEGTVHLRQSNQTVPQTLKVRLDIWNQFADNSLGVTFKYPDFGVPTRVTSGFATGDPILHFEVWDFPASSYISAFAIRLHSNPGLLPLATWFDQNIDVNHILAMSESFSLKRLQNGQDVLAFAAPLPTEYLQLAGPVEEAFVMSLSGDRVASIVQSHENELVDLGYSQEEVQEILVQILGTLEF